MALTERLGKLAEHTTPRCTLGRFTEQLTEEERALLQTLLDMPRERLSTTRIKHELSAEGHHFSRETIGRHRDRTCACHHGKVQP